MKKGCSIWGSKMTSKMSHFWSSKRGSKKVPKWLMPRRSWTTKVFRTKNENILRNQTSKNREISGPKRYFSCHTGLKPLFTPIFSWIYQEVIKKWHFTDKKFQSALKKNVFALQNAKDNREKWSAKNTTLHKFFQNFDMMMTSKMTSSHHRTWHFSVL